MEKDYEKERQKEGQAQSKETTSTGTDQNNQTTSTKSVIASKNNDLLEEAGKLVLSHCNLRSENNNL